MTMVIILIACALLWSIREIIVGFWVWKSRRHYRHIYRVEVTQSYFGEARAQLLDLVKHGELSDASATFRFFYYLDTYILRRPEAYPQISAVLQQSILSEKEGSMSNELLTESLNWNAKTRELIFRHAAAIDNLIVSHSRVLRFLRAIIKIITRFIPARFINGLRNAIRDFIKEREDETARDLRASQAKLNNLAGGSGIAIGQT